MNDHSTEFSIIDGRIRLTVQIPCARPLCHNDAPGGGYCPKCKAVFSNLAPQLAVLKASSAAMTSIIEGLWADRAEDLAARLAALKDHMANMKPVIDDLLAAREADLAF